MKLNSKGIILLSSLLASSQALAMTVYENDAHKVDISGAFLMDYFQPVHVLDHFFNTSRSTLGISIASQFGHGWSGDVKFEWDSFINAPANDLGDQYGESGLRSRLGYFTVTNEDLGSIRVGKQYSAYHDVAGYMDNLIVFDPDATPLFSDGKDGGFMGTARGDNLITYRKSFDNLNLSAQYGFNNVQNQGKTLDRDNNFAFSASYDFDFGLSVGATHLQNNVDIKAGAAQTGLESGEDQQITTIAAKYVYQNFKVAAAYTDGTKAHETGLLAYSPNLYADATGIDMYAEYYFEIGLRPYVYLSNVDFDDVNANGDRSIYSMGLSYHATPQLIISGEVRKTEEDVLVGKQEDTLSGLTIIYAF